MEEKLSKYLIGFRKGHGTQNALLNMIENWKNQIDNNNKIGAIIMDLSKAFDTLNHELIIAKLYAYGFEENAVVFLHSYLSSRHQRTKINNSFSEWSCLLCGVPQGSILGPRLFNIYLNDMFLFISEDSNLCNYADDNTLYVYNKDFQYVLSKLNDDFLILNNWFYENYMILNPEKCSFLCLGIKDISSININLQGHLLTASKEEKILGIYIDHKLNFDLHIKMLCKKASQKLNALSRISPYINEKQAKLLVNAFVKSQFNYCPLIWMFCSRKSNRKINTIHERSLRLIFNDYENSFEELLLLNNDFTIHQRCLQMLVIEIYKSVNELSPEIMKNIFPIQKPNYNLRKPNLIRFMNPNSYKFGLNSIKIRSNQIWKKLSNEIKKIDSFEKFKSKIRLQHIDGCQCQICNIYILNLGYLY